MKRTDQNKKGLSGSVSAWDSALRYLASSARTKKEMERHLAEMGYGEEEIRTTMDRLEESGLLDDESYCMEFVGSRLRSKPVSRLHLYEQLRLHGAEEGAIEHALNTVSKEIENENAVRIARKYARQFSSLPDEMRTDRVYKRLLARGFDRDTIRIAIETVGSFSETECDDDE